MRLLIIGIDGADARIFRGFQMPVVTECMATGQVVPVVEDLWSRGWAEILTGQHGVETGAFYEKPALDGTHEFTQSFGRKDLDALPESEPLWELIGSRGLKAGFMNLPTTMPAPKVDGFLVAGAGGGLGDVGGCIPEPACHPPEISGLLERLGYVMDFRFMYNPITEIDELFDRLFNMLEKRTDAFLELSKRHRIDVGFIAFMATTRIQYLAQSEIETLLQADPVMAEGTDAPFRNGLRRLYRMLDIQVGRLLEALQPERWLVVGDHGAAPYTHRGNLDDFLQKIGFQQVSQAKASAGRALRRVVPLRWKKRFQHPARRFASGLKTGVNWDSTQAFGHRYVHGVYVNDQERFGGPVVGSRAVSHAVREICEAFNQTGEARKFSMHARPYREEHATARFSAALPDIWIDRPDTIFFENAGPFVEVNPDYGPIPDLSKVTRDIYAGVKGRHPLVCADPDTAALREVGDPSDLRLVYRIVDRALQ